MTKNPTGKERVALAFLLGMLAVLGPLNIDMYLPSFLQIADDLNARASLVQLSLTTCLIGLAVGQLVVGPISDSMGRKKPLLFSIVLFAGASILCALSPNITTLIIGRFLQGFTAAAGIVVSRAVVRDTFSGHELTKFFALLMVINAVAPMLAPMAGGAILLMPGASWSTIFYFLAFLGLMIVLVASWKLKETLPPEKRVKGSVLKTFITFKDLVKDRSFVGYALTLGLGHGGSFAYVAGTPFVYQGIYGVNEQVYGVLFGINGLAIILGTFLVGRYAGIIHERSFLKTGVLIASIATFVLFLMALVQGPLWTIVASIFVYMISMGMITTTSFSLGIANQSHRAGSASAMLGMLPLLIGAGVAPLVGLNEQTAIPMATIMFITSLFALLACVCLTKKEDSHLA
ncbi:Bcr/CflA family efflux MFS transporter [Shouchella patagoniensis]|uniref:Bcr/CflA family efflux MFS transporter n=1 Tax=Shouchella patagoniensis TaxID=228576 RepID=UPI000995C981|nr:Bcr/CflA family efflux MFS transporter [Shouchella patagoniensis]